MPPPGPVLSAGLGSGKERQAPSPPPCTAGSWIWLDGERSPSPGPGSSRSFTLLLSPANPPLGSFWASSGDLLSSAQEAPSGPGPAGSSPRGLFLALVLAYHPSLWATGNRTAHPGLRGPQSNHASGTPKQTLLPLPGPPGDKSRSQIWGEGPIGRLRPPPHHRPKRPKEQLQGPILCLTSSTALTLPAPCAPPGDQPTCRATVTPKQYPKCQCTHTLLGGFCNMYISSALTPRHPNPHHQVLDACLVRPLK